MSVKGVFRRGLWYRIGTFLIIDLLGGLGSVPNESSMGRNNFTIGHKRKMNAVIHWAILMKR